MLKLIFSTTLASHVIRGQDFLILFNFPSNKISIFILELALKNDEKASIAHSFIWLAF